MTRSVKNFHFFLTLKPDLNSSYLKLKTFIYEVLIYYQWMSKVTWYFGMLIMQADTFYQTSHFFL